MFLNKISQYTRRNVFYLKQLTLYPKLSTDVRCNQQQLEHASNVKDLLHTENDWNSAKEYDAMPGPSIKDMVFDFLPGGELHNSNLIEMNRVMRERYGDIYRIKGIFGKPDVIFTYNPSDFELTYRNEGIWPIRIGLQSFTYYRIVKRPDVFQGIGGLVSEQGKPWADIRNKVNPILMKIQNVRQNLTEIDEISCEFITRLETLRDPCTNSLKNSFQEELKMWAFESICYIALNMRMGLLSNKPDPNARKLADNMSDFFQYSYEYDVVPSFWKYYETPGFKRLLRTYDNITDITTNYIDNAIKKFEIEGNAEAKSVLEKLCRIDKQVAVVMAMDMLMAGIDTTSSAFITMLYLLAKNPAKQQILREELQTLMPDKMSPLTESNTKNMPYLRACLKEALRITPITPGNFRMLAKDLALSGYKVPAGTGVVMNVMALANTEQFFPRSKEFLPERWLKTDSKMSCPHAKSKNPFVYLPFGFGPRTCIGKRIAEMEIEALLSRIIRNYKVTWCGANDLKYISNIILIPHGNINFKFEPV